VSVPVLVSATCPRTACRGWTGDDGRIVNCPFHVEVCVLVEQASATPRCPECSLPVVTGWAEVSQLGECCGLVLEFDRAGVLVAQETP
jgi:hypothetical protein